ncbi:MAG TPA: Trm112 family protein [Terracidiphilus sp.]
MPGDSVQPDSSRPPQPLASVLDQLACPACLAGLQVDASGLLCTACGRHYPIVDGIPVLIADAPGQE